MALQRDVVLTIGTFDGVHLGHRHLLHQVVRRARERRCLSGAITFHPHPRAVVTGHGPACLSTLDERLALLRGLGLDVVVALPFTPERAWLPAREFMSQLCRSLRLHELWVGSDFALGHRREGTLTRLAEIGRDLGYQVHGVPPLVLDGQTVSSTLIRKLVGQGELGTAARLLKRRYHVSGIAMPGDQRDHDLAFPTATVVVSGGLAVPAGGVYAACVRSADSQWPATVRVEPDPDGTVRRLEMPMLRNPDGLYGQSLRIEFARRLEPSAPAQPVRMPMDKVPAQRQALSPA